MGVRLEEMEARGSAAWRQVDLYQTLGYVPVQRSRASSETASLLIVDRKGHLDFLNAPVGHQKPQVLWSRIDLWIGCRYCYMTWATRLAAVQSSWMHLKAQEELNFNRGPAGPRVHVDDYNTLSIGSKQDHGINDLHVSFT